MRCVHASGMLESNTNGGVMMTGGGESSIPMQGGLSSIHIAERASGPSGAGLYAEEIDFAGGVARRSLGQDVVVRGNDSSLNRRIAEQMESAVGPAQRQDPHVRAGLQSLPHYQQENPPPEGHTFYETAKRKAKKAP